MTLEQFEEALLSEGYKRDDENYLGPNIFFIKRNKQISIQDWGTIYIVYLRYTKNSSYEFTQKDVTDFKKALRNIHAFERTLGL